MPLLSRSRFLQAALARSKPRWGDLAFKGGSSLCLSSASLGDSFHGRWGGFGSPKAGSVAIASAVAACGLRRHLPGPKQTSAPVSLQRFVADKLYAFQDHEPAWIERWMANRREGQDSGKWHMG